MVKPKVYFEGTLFATGRMGEKMCKKLKAIIGREMVIKEKRRKPI